jgi:hypothetical protein
MWYVIENRQVEIFVEPLTRIGGFGGSAKQTIKNDWGISGPEHSAATTSR